MRLIAKERLSGRPSPIINAELEFEGSGRALHYFATLIYGERGEKWVVSRIFAPDCRFFVLRSSKSISRALGLRKRFSVLTDKNLLFSDK